MLNDIEGLLVRVLTEQVRSGSSGTHYEYSEVRIAAARALRTRYAVCAEPGGDVVRCHATKEEEPGYTVPAPLIDLLLTWSEAMQAENSDEMRKKLRSVVLKGQSAPERALAAFALGDLACRDDARFLIAVIVAPTPKGITSWDDTIWTAADALIMFDPTLVADLLVDLLRRERTFSPASTRQIIYVAGRVRANEQVVIDWLLEQMMYHPDMVLKARALQSLAWLGESFQSYTWLTDTLLAHGIPVHEPPRTLVQRFVKNVALWNEEYLKNLNVITDDEKVRQQVASGKVDYFRLKAIESMAWLGDRQTIGELRPHIHTWPVGLRTAWYTTVAAIEARLSDWRTRARQ